MTREEKREYERERRLAKRIEKLEREWHAEVQAFMDKGIDFEAAWVAAGGMIIPLSEIRSGL